MAGISDFRRGDRKPITLTFKKKDNSHIDISTATVYFTVKKSYDDPDSAAVIRKVITNHIDPNNGKTEFAIEYEDTKDLQAIQYCYDIRIVFPTEQVTTVLNSSFKLLPEVTKEV